MISVAIQAGGESRRMGQDKALLPFLGTTLLERVLGRVAPLGDEVLITTNNPEDYQDFNVPLYQDLLPGRGALGGLLTAISAARFPLVIVVACDMPFVSVDILTVSIEKLQSKEVDVVIPQSKEGYEPFHAVYRRQTCLPAIQNALKAGERRLISWFPNVNVVPISGAELLKYDPLQIAFRNLNTNEDLLQAEAFARESGL